LKINKLHFPVTTLGYGHRVGIWTQGCSIRCPGCISRDTWESDSSSEIQIEGLLRAVGPWLKLADGVTISGGEPFDQPEALAAFLKLMRKVFSGDILAYSGYPHQRLFADYAETLKFVDVLISEPFDSAAGQTLALRGSDNQRIFLLTDLARARYPSNLDRQLWGDERRLDVVVTGNEVWMAGIPRIGDLARFREQLARRGFYSHSSDQPQPVLRA
jgi:anaerobic ribonucleoside-triphosphate reductase activating protein